jgi:tetratricopeptide (TPR) repeat protein
VNPASPTPTAKKGAKAVPLDPDELAALEEQRDFLLRSLADLDREHDAGDLEDDDYETLKDDYTARAADVLRAIDEQRAAFDDARRPRSLGRTFAWVAVVVLFAIVSGVMVAKAMGSRKAGESVSGGINVAQTSSQRANACVGKMGTDPQGASDCFEKVLAKDKQNAVALTWSAWQLSLSAPNFPEPDRSTAQALAAYRLEQAVESQPSYSYARAFRAVVAYRNGRYDDAEKFLQEFEANDPSADAAQVIKQMDLEAKIAEAKAGGTTTTVASPGG